MAEYLKIAQTHTQELLGHGRYAVKFPDRVQCGDLVDMDGHSLALRLPPALKRQAIWHLADSSMSSCFSWLNSLIDLIACCLVGLPLFGFRFAKCCVIWISVSALKKLQNEQFREENNFSVDCYKVSVYMCATPRNSLSRKQQCKVLKSKSLRIIAGPPTPLPPMPPLYDCARRSAPVTMQKESNRLIYG